MDRNSAIGLTLIAALLLAYFYFFAPEPQPAVQPIKKENQAAAQPDTASSETKVKNDSLLAATYGDLSSFVQGDEKSFA
jgi:YidC/Oxa1 family membrane protein insertase